VPFIRVIRDKRGYETTYLMHWYREGARQRSRILYVFRSPGGVRVGRESLEPEILRDIEANYPDIAFDWKAVLDNKQIVETAPEIRRPRKRRRSEEEAEPGAPKPHPSTSARGASSGLEGHSGEGGPTPDSVESGPKPHPPTSARGSLSGVEGQSSESGPKPHGGEGGPPRPLIPSAMQGATPDEQTAFLARWYPIVRDRIPQRTADPARREALLALAERMNPAAWTDADQIVAGLQQAGEALERLSRVFARRRRRPRRAKGPDKSAPAEARAQRASPGGAGESEPDLPHGPAESELAAPRAPAESELASPKPHPSTPARDALSDVEGHASTSTRGALGDIEGQSGEGG
jgi:hypothetical protein